MIPRSRSLPKSTFINLIPGNCLVLSFFFPDLFYVSSNIYLPRFPKEILFSGAFWLLFVYGCLFLGLNSDLSAIKLGNEQWFFFCELKIASRLNKTTKCGYWKVTGKDRHIKSGKSGPGNSSLIGIKKTLVYHTGHDPKGKRTNWVVYEYHAIATRQVCFLKKQEFFFGGPRESMKCN